jgi:hypothetical protein
MNFSIVDATQSYKIALDLYSPHIVKPPTPRSMKISTLILSALAGLALSSQLHAQATQVWNPGGNPNAGGTWSTTAANWDAGVVWTNGNNASFTSGSLMSNSVDLSGPISATNVNLSTNTDLTIASNATANSLTVSGVVNVPVIAAQPANLTFLRNNGVANITHTLSGTGIVGGGTLTLDKQGTGTNPNGNLFVALTGANTTVNVGGGIALTGKGNAGLVGFVATGGTTGAHIDSSITNASSVATFLGASAGNQLTVNGVIDSTPGPGIQIGSQSLGFTGEVALGATGIIGDTTAINLSGGTLLVGDTATANATENMGTLTLTANSIIDFNEDRTTDGYSLRFAFSDLNSWTGTLAVWNYKPGLDHLFFTTQSGFGPGVVGSDYGLVPYTDDIVFYSGAGTGQLASGAGWVAATGEVVPVPEPTALLSAGLLLLVIAWKERRLFARVRSPELDLPLPA